MNFTVIKSCILASSIANDDKNKLIEMFADIPDDLLVDAAKLFEKDPSWVEKVSENKKKKETALASGNTDMWNEIIEEEKRYLTDLTYDLD